MTQYVTTGGGGWGQTVIKQVKKKKRGEGADCSVEWQ